MAGRRIFNQQDARRCLAGVRSAGGDLGAWARSHCIDGCSLNLWRANLERRGASGRRAGRPKVVELVPAPPRPVVRQTYVLRVAGVELEVGENFDERALRRLIGVLKSC